MNESTTFTGIPVDVLWGALVAMVGVVYWDLKREVRLNRKESVKRGREAATFKIYLKMLCEKAGIEFYDGHDD